VEVGLAWLTAVGEPEVLQVLEEGRGSDGLLPVDGEPGKGDGVVPGGEAALDGLGGVGAVGIVLCAAEGGGAEFFGSSAEVGKECFLWDVAVIGGEGEHWMWICEKCDFNAVMWEECGLVRPEG